MKDNLCHISKKHVAANMLHSYGTLNPNLVNLIKADFPDFDEQSSISSPELNKYRQKYLHSLIEDEKGQLSKLEKEVVNSIANNESLASRVLRDKPQSFTTGQRLADKIASFGGSWTFIITFFSFLVLWMTTNVLMFAGAFDPYPFILLNLILSCLAAIQAPIIMMSQNRQEEKDRDRAENDYKINLKAELEIRLLHEKMDHLLIHQNQKLIEIQELQTDFMNDMMMAIKSKKD